MVRILGLDPGLAETGFGIILAQGSVLRHLAHGAISTDAKMSLGSRLHVLFLRLQEIFAQYQVGEASIESLFFAKNISSAIPVAHARGVMLLACAHAGIPVCEYTPPEIKLAVCGHGRADKNQVQEMVKVLLSLDSIPKPNHAADALAAAICQAHRRGFNSALSKGMA